MLRAFVLSRRRFLQTGSLAAGASIALPTLAHAAEGDQSLPPAIAALRTLRGEAKPITVEERAGRQEKARRLMRENNLSAILLTPGTSLAYFTGIRWEGGERLFAMVLPAKAEAFCVSPAFEEGRAREQIAQSPDGSKPDLRVWQEDESPYVRVAQGLSDRGIDSGTVGVEETVKFVFSDNLRKAATSATFTSTTPVTAGCRMIKSRHEIELMRLASKVTLAAYEATYRSTRVGMTAARCRRHAGSGAPQTGIRRRPRCTGGPVFRFPPCITPAAGHSGKHDRADRRWLLGGRLCVRYHAHLCTRQSQRQNETGVRHRTSSPERRIGIREARSGSRLRGRRRTQSHHRRRLRPRLQILHASPGTRNGHGRP